MRCHLLLLVAKTCPVCVEVIDGISLASRDTIHKTQFLDLFIHGHSSTVIFNVIQSPSNPIILSLSWLDRYNPQVDWSNQKIKFQSNHLKALDMQIIEKLEKSKSPNPEPHRVKTSKVQVPMTVGARAFMKTTKNGAIVAIYATPIATPIQTTSELPV